VDTDRIEQKQRVIGILAGPAFVAGMLCAAAARPAAAGDELVLVRGGQTGELVQLAFAARQEQKRAQINWPRKAQIEHSGRESFWGKRASKWQIVA
jgi:hypothetical protein